MFLLKKCYPNSFGKECGKEWHCFTFLQTSLISGLVGNSRILFLVSVLNPLQCVILVEIYEEHAVGKWRNILVALADNCRCFLIPSLNSSAGFLKIGCSVESGTMMMNLVPIACNSKVYLVYVTIRLYTLCMILFKILPH